MVQLNFATLSSLCRFSEYLFDVYGKPVAVCKAPIAWEPGESIPTCDEENCPVLHCHAPAEGKNRPAEERQAKKK